MVDLPAIESLRETLAPVEALRGEHSQLESWVLESFAALDSLHGELTEWQRELTRQQAALDQRAEEVKDGGESPRAAACGSESQLAACREEVRQLEAENAEQLQAIEQLDRQLAVVNAELRLARKHAEEQQQWRSELHELRRILEGHAALLRRLTDTNGSTSDGSTADEGNSNNDDLAERGEDVVAKAAELRRRASTRRARSN